MTEHDVHDVSYIAPELRALAVPIAELEADPNNAREHDDQQLADIQRSIELFGQQRAIVAKDGIVRAGSGVFTAMKRLGYKWIACSRTDLDDDKLEAFAIADNRTAERSTWNRDRLAAQLARAKANGFDTQRDLGFSKREVGSLIARLRGTDETTDETVTPSEPRTQAGDLWAMGPHRLLCGDSFSDADRRRLLSGGSDRDPILVDLVLTDPPFAIYGSSTGIGRDIADDKMVRPFFESLFRAIHAHAREFAHVYVHCDWRSWASIWGAAQRAGIVPKNCLVWDKGHFGMGGMYGNAHEFVGFFAKLPPATTMISTERRGLRGVNGKANILRFPRVSGDEREHNAAKPVAMLEELILNSTDPGEAVLDLFGGSGSTLIAADRVERAAYVMEMEPKWCDVIVSRWERRSGAQAIRLAPGETGSGSEVR